MKQFPVAVIIEKTRLDNLETLYTSIQNLINRADDPDERNIESVIRKLVLLDLLEQHLARSPFMAGEHFTMADIPIGCEMHRWWGLPQERPARPALERWYRTVSTRPGARGVLDQPLA